MAVFDVFRHSFEDGDKNTRVQEGTEPATKDYSRSNARRVGVSEDELRAHVKAHLETLMNTVRLDAVSDLTDHPNVARSVLNYGFRDLSDLSRRELLAQDISQSIKQSLRDHEPRLVDNSIEVKIQATGGDAAQRVGLQVMAELIADPADIPVDYEADIDTGSGKVVLQPQAR
ncbi:type VI secretion system baseplate subunit TssE [Tritonibacter multivorans]|uniref:type VI secretion system baseplate subunit TssE n=1 Tax=Tritonibacter multivorans TaxID=928856 RepID=UPI00071D6277|nr:type VI secretion system baseplate subunit TssE [Tritonibacter multivorans]MDA7422929.1 type VI secretion system baseplate subunit TssE [Tritonibacter multivorans]